MKRIVLVFTAVMAFAAASYAQGGFRLGAKLGANLNKVEGQSFSDGFDLSYHVGAFAEIDFNKKMGYTARGAVEPDHGQAYQF